MLVNTAFLARLCNLCFISQVPQELFYVHMCSGDQVEAGEIGLRVSEGKAY